MAVPCTLEDLEAELLTLVQDTSAFKDKAFSIFTLLEMEKLSTDQPGNLPIVGVGYDGAVPKGNQVDPKGADTPASAFIDVQFLIVIAAQYEMRGQGDNKQSVMALLHEIRLNVIGYKKANTRAWRFVGEKPEPSASVDGLIFYSQVWQTSVPFVGRHSN